jgi:hypothetical protein
MAVEGVSGGGHATPATATTCTAALRDPGYGVCSQRATDHGFHCLAAIMAALSALLLICTIIDRTIPRALAG